MGSHHSFGKTYQTFLDFVNRGTEYRVIQAIGDLEKDVCLQVVGRVWDGSLHANEFGFRIECLEYRYCLAEHIYQNLFEHPEKYLERVGDFDIDALEKERLKAIREGGIGSRLP